MTEAQTNDIENALGQITGLATVDRPLKPEGGDKAFERLREIHSIAERLINRLIVEKMQPVAK